MPKLIGIIKLSFPKLLKKAADNDGITEMVGELACDEDGQLWGLVVRHTPLPEGGRRYLRLDYVRWVRFNAIPFAEDEVVEPFTDNTPKGKAR